MADLDEERTLDGMRIIRTGRGCYLCYSDSRPGCAYAVDLSEFNGLGSCQCEDFLYRGLPRYRKVGKPFDVYRCRHIRRTRNYVLDAIIAHYSHTKTNPDEN